jgi:hypothetical protein
MYTCKTNGIPMLMHQMSISTNKVSSVMLRPKKRCKSKNKCANVKRAGKEMIRNTVS